MVTNATGAVVQGKAGVLGLLPDGQVEAIAAVRAARDEAARWQSFQLELTAHVADLCGSLDGDPRYRLPGMERLVQVGHDGTPRVAEFMMDELAAALGVSVEVADAQIEFALDLRHRMPRLWKKVLAGRVSQWVAKDLVAETADLGLDECRQVDEAIDHLAGSMSHRRLVAMVKGLVMGLLPVEVAEQRRRDELDARQVFIGDEGEGLSAVHATLDRLDGKLLDASVDWISRILRHGGRDESEDARRAMALGILATPARALQLMQASLTDEVDELPLAEPGEDDCPRRGQVGHTCGSVTVDPEKLLPRSEVVVHLTDRTLINREGLARCDRLGPMLVGHLTQLLEGRRVSLRPVIDGERRVASDAYECPASMRRMIELRSPYVAWPWSNRRSSGQGVDLDHVRPYRSGGPPGQTRPENLMPLTRRAHRVKTHGRWVAQQVAPGVMIWTSRLGAVYAVTRDGTHELHSPFVMGRETARALRVAAG